MKLKEKFRPLVWFNYNSFNVHQNKEKDENSIKCEIIAEEFAIGFVEWLINKEYHIDIWVKNNNTKKLLEIYKKEKGL